MKILYNNKKIVHNKWITYLNIPIYYFGDEILYSDICELRLNVFNIELYVGEFFYSSYKYDLDEINALKVDYSRIKKGKTDVIF